MKTFEMYSPTRLLFGPGVLNQLGEKPMPGKKALLVISNGRSTKANGYLDRTCEQLEKAGVAYTIFDKIEANPLDTTVMDGAAAGRANGCDFIVALGGGSVMDASKAIAAMVTNAGDLWDYMVVGSGGGKTLVNKPLPIVAISTTAGTGSEVDKAGVISNEKTGEKLAFGGTDEFFPVLAIVDCELMTSVPPRFTAYQGFDALFHSVEGYISLMRNHMSDMYAITAVRYIGKYLARAVRDGEDIEARDGVAFANSLGGTVMVVGQLTSEHSIEHALSAKNHDLPHGAGLIMISLAYYQYLIDQHACDDRFVDLAKALGKEDASDPQDFITALQSLQEACGVSDLKMSDYGITPDDFEEMAKRSREMLPLLYMLDPSPISDEAVVQIFRDSYR